VYYHGREFKIWKTDLVVDKIGCDNIASVKILEIEGDSIIDEFVKRRIYPLTVIPAKAGIQ
jgi:hypothetical protein